MGRVVCLRSWHAPQPPYPFFRRRKRVHVSAIPTQYPVTMTDGDNDYIVSNASEYVNAVYKLGHEPKIEAAVVVDTENDASKSK